MNKYSMIIEALTELKKECLSVTCDECIFCGDNSR